MKGIRAAVVGGGNMGAIIGRALVARKLVSEDELRFIERDPARREYLGANFSSKVLEYTNPELGDASVVLLCVKPQDARAACELLRPVVRSEHLVISIMAGVPIALLSELLGTSKVVRAMPNLPFQVGQGMTVYTASKACSEADKGVADKIFRAGGLSLYVEDEGLLNAATAVSGTGPAYLFYVMEHLIRSTALLGFNEEQAHLLIRQTLEGSLELWDASGISPQELRRMVTSKGGTTAAAMSVFDQAGLGEVLERGIMAAKKRADELAPG